MITVKVGGSVLNRIEEIARDLQGRQFVLVHGFGQQVDRACRERGIEPRWVVSPNGILSRYTDNVTIQVCVEVARNLNNTIVEILSRFGIKARGFLGSDQKLVIANRKAKIKVVENNRKRIIEGGYTGTIQQINTRFLSNLLTDGYSTVISPIAISHENKMLNVNGDRLAANLAGSLNTETLVNLSDVPGVLRNEEIIPVVRKSELDNLIQEVGGGMVIKLFSVKEAFELGVNKVIIASGTVKNPIQNALRGNGTVFIND